MNIAVDEHAIDARRFKDALLWQRRTGMKGGIYHLTQIQMAYNSNRIEGSELTEEQTRHLFDTRTVDGPAPLDDVIEASNHFIAFNQMLDNVGQPLTAEMIKAYHATLKTGTADAQQPRFAVGEWKRLANQVGDTETSAPEAVADDMAKLLAGTPPHMSFEDVCDFHHRFEVIHPFQDGNGRVGRLVLFQQCLENDLLPVVVLDRDKLFYYQGLAKYDTEPGFLRETFRHFQDEYRRKYTNFVPAAG